MKNIRFFSAFIVLSLVLTACKDRSSSNNSEDTTQQDVQESSDHPLLGSFVGYFGEGGNANKITIIISQLEKEEVKGRSIVGGNDRPFAGTFEEKEGIYYVKAKEPGDDKYDGEFAMELNPENPSELKGSWEPFRPSTQPKTFKLERKKFVYNPNNGNYPQASLRLLKTEEVENEMKETLAYMRNEIFARHGYCFKKKEWREMFELNEWYVPNTADVKLKLTSVEKKNINLIKRYEKYAAEYGDEFGR